MEPINTRILLIDDESALRAMLEIGLQRAGFAVTGLSDGRHAVETIRREAPQLIILDVMLPGVDGIALLPVLRAVTEVPIIMLSAKTDTEDKVAGLIRGADDYVAKPFELTELIARIHSALRRPRLSQGETLRYADLTVDVTQRLVKRRERRIDLSSREFDLLLTLMQMPESVFSRAQLLDLVWGFNSDTFPNTLDTYISYLRAKIDSGEEVKLIKTLRGAGYMLSANPT